MKWIGLLFLFSCANDPFKLSEEGRKVVIRSKSDLGTTCETVGKVLGQNTFGSLEVARNDARNKVADMGGEILVIKDEVSNGQKAEVHGLGYRCP